MPVSIKSNPLGGEGIISIDGVETVRITEGKLEIFVGGSWAELGEGGGASSLGDLSDVSTTGATTGNVLTYNGTTWVPDEVVISPSGFDTAGAGLTSSGSTVSVDSTVVRTNRTISTGDGLNGGGNLSANRAFSVDSTVIRTSGNQSMSGIKTFTNEIRLPNASGTGNNINIGANDHFISEHSGALVMYPNVGSGTGFRVRTHNNRSGYNNRLIVDNEKVQIVNAALIIPVV